MIPRLLFIAPSSPFPPQDGKRQRTLAFLLAALQDYSVDYLALDGHLGKELTYIPDGLRDRFRFVSLPLSHDPKWIKKLGLSFFPNAKNQELFCELLESTSYDRIFCRYVSSARDLPPNKRIVLDVDDDYEEMMQSKISKERNIYKKLRIWQIFQFNRFFYQRIINKAKSTIWVKSEFGKWKGKVLANLPFQILFAGKPKLVQAATSDILFVGKLSYEPNSEGLKWFLLHVWTELTGVNSSVKLNVVSTVKPAVELEKLIEDSEGVSLYVGVSDIVEVYHHNKVSIVPIFFGGGSNIKLSESLLMGRTVVASEFGARGYSEWVQKGFVSIADTPQKWVLAITEALNRPWQESEWQRVGDNFSLEAWNKKFLSILHES